MRRCRRSRSILFLIGALGVCPMATGCAELNEPEYAINWSGEGRLVGFQHGVKGVFLSDSDGTQFRKIFQPGPDATATSPPLWSPTDSHVIFATARHDPRNGPEGNHSDALYTCRLYDGSAGADSPPPAALFEAPCELDYVRMNTAVRWHPSGRRILFIRRLKGDQHGLFEYDLGSKQSQQVFPHTAPAFSFEWAPGGTHLACVLGGKEIPPEIAGLWVGDPTKHDWWHVQTNDDLSKLREAKLPAVCARQPAWTRDGTRFATMVELDGSKPRPYQLAFGTPAKRELVVRLNESHPLLELRWSPDGTRLGFLRGSEHSEHEFCLLAIGEKSGLVARRNDVRRFIGWDSSGKNLAFVVPQRASTPGDNWAFLFTVDYPPRDRVYVANGADASNERPVLTGLRVTFPQWSPRDEKLSLWTAYQPPYVSFFRSFLLFGSAPPAGTPTLLDSGSKQLGWLPVDSDDRLHIGHCALVRGEYGEALRWYERAKREFAFSGEEASDENRPAVQLVDRRGLPLFEYYCLSKLGRPAEAQRALTRFDDSFISPEMAQALVQQPGLLISAEDAKDSKEDIERYAKEFLDPSSCWQPVARDGYLVESFLALNAGEEAATLLRRWLSRAKADGTRMAHAVFLGQLLLIQKRYQEYAKLAAEEIIPLTDSVQRSRPRPFGPKLLWPEELLQEICCEAVKPLLVPEFLARLSPAEVNALVGRWELGLASDSQKARWFVSQLGLYAAYARLGKLDEARRVERRFDRAAGSAANPFKKKTAKAAIEEIRDAAGR